MIQILIVIIAVALDQFSKVWMTEFLAGHSGYFELWPKVFNLLYIENKGAAFGMLQGARWIFIGITIAVIIGATIYLIKTRKSSTMLLKISSAMIIGGAIGNLIDRIASGIVIDFFYFELINFAVFNIADSFVTVGAILLGIYILFFHKFEDDKKRVKDE
jgi:signal peptidase II